MEIDISHDLKKKSIELISPIVSLELSTAHINMAADKFENLFVDRERDGTRRAVPDRK